MRNGKMKKKLSWIAVILDRSGSMSNIRQDAIGGFNTFIDAQRQVPGEALVTLVLFDHEYEVPYTNKALADVPLLNNNTYIPRGNTALLDAIGRTIIDMGSKLDSLKEADKPEHVIVVILTDGQENSSHEFDNAKIKELITHQTDVYSWQFIYIAANVDTFANAIAYGIPVASSYSYTPDRIGTQEAYRTMSFAVASARSEPLEIDWPDDIKDSVSNLVSNTDTDRVARTSGVKSPLP